MIVCVCHQVSDREITRQARSGLDFSDIQLELGVATQCGRCEGCARTLVSDCRSSLAPPTPGNPCSPGRAAVAWSPA